MTGQHACDATCAHTIDVGHVHTRTDTGTCRPDCPHPSHRSHVRDGRDEQGLISGTRQTKEKS